MLALASYRCSHRSWSKQILICGNVRFLRIWDCIPTVRLYMDVTWVAAHSFTKSNGTVNSFRPSDAYVSANSAIIASDNGLSPVRRQTIIRINAGILLIGLMGTNLGEILIEIYIFSYKKMHLNLSSGYCRPFCLGLNALNKKVDSSSNCKQDVIENTQVGHR